AAPGAAAAGFAATPAGAVAGFADGSATGLVPAEAAGVRAAAAGGLLAAAPGFASAAGADLPASGAPVAPSGVPQRAQNLNVAAFKVMQWGHCLGGAPEACSLDAGLGDDFATRVVADPCSGSEAPQERQEPTSVSLCAPHFGQSMSGIVVLGREQGQGRPGPTRAVFQRPFPRWNKPRSCANLRCPGELPWSHRESGAEVLPTLPARACARNDAAVRVL